MRSSLSAAIVLVVLLAASPPSGSALAQDHLDLQVKVYTLKYLDCYEAHEQVEQIFAQTEAFARVTMSTDQRTNSLICRAPASCHTNIALLLGEIDVESMSEDTGQEWVYRLVYRQAEDVADVLQSAISRRMRLAYDDHTNVIILQGPETDLRRAKTLLAALDVQQVPRTAAGGGTLKIMVHFVRASFGVTEPCTLPEELSGVAAALTDQGVGNCRPLGHVMARIRESESFKTSGVLRPMEAAGTTSTAMIAVQGSAFITETGQVDLTISTRLSVPTIRTHGRDDAGSAITNIEYVDVGLETIATVSMGQYLVLGAIPTTIEDSDTVLLVIRID